MLRIRIRDPVLFDPWIWDPDPGWEKNPDPDPGSRMNIPDRFSESLDTVLGLKILKFFDADTDPGSGMNKNSDPASGINIPDPQHCY
jgi:hypothetical protein